MKGFATVRLVGWMSYEEGNGKSTVFCGVHQ